MFIGDDEEGRFEDLKEKYPVRHGVIEDWEDMEKVWNYTFQVKLRVDPSEFPLLISEATLNPKNNREKISEVMFESFGLPSICIANQGVLSLLSSGRTTGLVCESGEGVT